jgi:hypothetical protein
MRLTVWKFVVLCLLASAAVVALSVLIFGSVIPGLLFILLTGVLAALAVAA